MKLKILNKRQIKNILFLIKEQWGAEVGFEHAFLQDKKGKLYIVNRDVGRIDLSRLRVNSIGMYFGLVKGGEIRLSIEASQMIGPYAKKNIVDLDSIQIRQWLAGRDLEYSGNGNGFVLIRSGEDFFGTGRIKEGRILNFVPKARRLMSREII